MSGLKHSPADISSNATVVPLSTKQAWCSALVLQCDKANANYAQFGVISQTIADGACGFEIGPGDTIAPPFPRDYLIPLHEIGFLHPGGVGKCRWFAVGYTEGVV